MENELIKLSWLNWVTSHSSWEASKKKTFKANRWTIIVIDYQPAKRFGVCKHFGRQDRSFSRLLEKSPEWRFD